MALSKESVWEFQEEQDRCIRYLSRKLDLLLLGPTACGKTFLIVRIARMLKRMNVEKFILVVVPLKTLADDIARKARNAKVGVQILVGDSKFTPKQWAKTSGLVVTTPEKVCRDLATLRAIEWQMKAGRVAVIHFDEVHLVSLWGRFFRPAYAEMGLFKGFSTAVPILGTSATLSQTVMDDIKKLLKIDPKIVRCVAKPRESLRFRLEVCEKPQTNAKKIDLIEAFHKKVDGGKIAMFCPTRSRATNNWKLLKKRGKVCGVFFRGGERCCARYLTSFLKDDKYKIMSTTSVMGVGIDVPGIKGIVHESIPWGLEDYVQQNGRAARRQGTHGFCKLLFSMTDVYRYYRQFTAIDHRSLWQMVLFCLSDRCPQLNILEYFGEKQTDHKCEDCPKRKHVPVPAPTYGQLQDICTVVLNSSVKLSAFYKVIKRIMRCTERQSYVTMSRLMYMDVFQVSDGLYVKLSCGYCDLFY